MSCGPSDYTFCSCVRGRVSELDGMFEKYAGMADNLYARAQTLLTNESAFERELRFMHVHYLDATKSRHRDGSNEGRCFIGCKPTFMNEMGTRLWAKLVAYESAYGAPEQLRKAPPASVPAVAWKRQEAPELEMVA